MTTIITILIGAGVLFIASGLECQPLVSTFQKIISNQAIDWSGSAACSTATSASTTGTTPNPVSTPKTAPNAVGQCPPGYIKSSDGNCYSAAGI